MKPHRPDQPGGWDSPWWDYAGYLFGGAFLISASYDLIWLWGALILGVLLAIRSWVRRPA